MPRRTVADELRRVMHRWLLRAGRLPQGERVYARSGPQHTASSVPCLVARGVSLPSAAGELPGGAARRWEPKRLRLRLFTAAGRLVKAAAAVRGIARMFIGLIISVNLRNMGLLC